MTKSRRPQISFGLDRVPRVPMRVEGFGLDQNRRAHELTDFITPERDLFRVWHLGIPDVDLETWTLHVDGLVETTLVLGLDELRAWPRTEVTAFHECAGSPLNPCVPQRRIGNVIWGGIRLADLLRAARIQQGANYVISRGAEHGIFAGEAHDAYEKDLPIARATDGDALIALTVNGAPLPIDRGGPVRLVVPGFYGTNSTKWLARLTVSAARSPGVFTTRYYMDRETADGVEREAPVWSVAPNSILVTPTNGGPIALGPTRIWGWAWADKPIARVDVSTDGGDLWEPADVEPRQQRAWQRFSRDWCPQSVGEYVLRARATDEDGNTQPDTGRRNRTPTVVAFVRAQ